MNTISASSGDFVTAMRAMAATIRNVGGATPGNPPSDDRASLTGRQAPGEVLARRAYLVGSGPPLS